MTEFFQSPVTQAILAARDVGPLVMIDDRQVRDIEEAFHLD